VKPHAVDLESHATHRLGPFRSLEVDVVQTLGEQIRILHISFVQLEMRRHEHVRDVLKPHQAGKVPASVGVTPSDSPDIRFPFNNRVPS
jgi:hypothetical protein